MPRSNHSVAGVRPIVCCDFDGTVTQVDVTDQILSQYAHPSWREVEQEWMRGLIGSRECLARQMALVEASAKELNTLIDSIPIDPGFPKLYRFLRRHHVPFHLVSDGFDYVIRRVLERAGVAGARRNGRGLHASALRIRGRRLVTSFSSACEHGCATCKAALVRRLGRGYRPVIFIGDGLSDRFAVHEARVVFAKRPLAAYCRENSVQCRRFETLAEVERDLEKIIEGE